MDPLADPGLADLSSHVDFSQIRDAAEDGGALFVGPVDQGRFLFGLGIEDRASALKRGGSCPLSTSDAAHNPPVGYAGGRRTVQQ